MVKEQTNFRIDADTKAQAYKVLSQIGLNPTDAVNMLMRHIAMFGELPFQPRIPNQTTQEVFEATDAGEELSRYDSVEALLKDSFSDMLT